ncbi:predicted protein [Botrytis cinerea T4]|uniref:Uncharacterized protein n=1 Tax=Botryotinia fuckeliana (strain T4) TaxID=999810 RepID=G2YRT9_BOTF4|nr:predicted protein [Botrytis cinerea T4]
MHPHPRPECLLGHLQIHFSSSSCLRGLPRQECDDAHDDDIQFQIFIEFFFVNQVK